jgi:ribonuclease HII
MKNYDKKYPQYGFSKHKGYPTKYHIKMLKKYGPCKIHRMSFKPVINLKLKAQSAKLQPKAKSLQN